MIPSKIIIVGGGTAGWMCANLLAQQWATKGCEIILVESKAIPTVGVGEGSTPFLRQFFARLNISESQWMPFCDATYKTGIDFPNWCQAPAPQSYFHPFYSEIDGPVADDFFSSCQQRREGFNTPCHPDDYFVTAHLARAHLSPVDDQNRDLGVDYGYHFDAEKLAHFLAQHAKRIGVTRLYDTINQVNVKNGAIESLDTLENGALKADLYIDCTGFKGRLIQQALGETYLDYSDYLPNNRAVAIGVPHQSSETLPSFTNSEALQHGWMWSIPLQSRSGNGYVYSDRYITPAQAEQTLRQQLNHPEGPALHLNWTPGRINQHWKQNCLAIGLSQGFLEPLEAPMLNMIQQSVEHFIQLSEISGQTTLDSVKQSFNRTINSLIDGTRDYLQAHYKLNSRTDTEYWRACRDNTQISAPLNDIITAWKHGANMDQVLAKHHSSLAYMKTSWYCLLAGMGHFHAPQRAALKLTSKRHARALSRCAQLAAQFPSQRQYLSRHQEIG